MKTIKQLLQDAQQAHQDAINNNDLNALHDSVLHQYNMLLNQLPDSPEILFLIATTNSQLGNNGLAISLLRRCIDLSGDHPEFWNNLGAAWKNENNTKEAIACFEKAIEMWPDNASYYSNMATIYINEGEPEKGLDYSVKSLELDVKNPKSHWNHALLLLEAGHMEDGLVAYDAGLISGDRMNRLYGSVPFYQGENPLEDLKGKTVIVYGEQGVGDELLYASALPDLIGLCKHVIFECHDRLESVMRRSFPEVEVYPSRKDDTVPAEIMAKLDTIDYRIAIGSLFRFMGVKKRPPYLKPDQALVNAYRERLNACGPGPYIGIGYAGGNKKTHAHARSFKLTPLRPIMEAVNCTLVSLQYTPEATEKFANWEHNTGIQIHHWPEVLYRGLDPGDNYEHTIALIAALDLVVVPNTAAVHVCGALGTPCITLTPDACAWRYRNGGEHMLWYQDHVTLVRENGDINDAIQRAAALIKERF